MDPATLAVLASIAGILAFIYIVLFGQRSLADLVERWRQKQQLKPQVVDGLYHELHVDFPRGYNRAQRLFDEAIEAYQLGLGRQLLKILSETVQEETLSEAVVSEATIGLDLMRSRLLLREGKLDEVARTYEDVLERLSLNDRLKADALSGRARIFFLNGDFQKAITYYKESIGLCEKLGAVKEESRAYNYLGVSYARQGKFSKAIDSFKKSLSLAYGLGDLRGAAFALIHAAYYSLLSGNDSIAYGYCRGALGIGERINDKLILGYANNILGRIYLAGKRVESAKERFSEARSLFRDVGDKYGEAIVQISLGGVARKEGNFPQAKRLLEGSIEIFDKQGDVDKQAEALDELGCLYRDQGDWDRAERHLRESLRLAQKCGNWYREVDILGDLCLLFYGKHKQDPSDANNLEQLRTYLREANRLARERGYLRFMSTTEEIYGALAYERGSYDEAFTHYVEACEAVSRQIATARGAWLRYVEMLDKVEDRLYELPNPNDIVQYSEYIAEEWGKRGNQAEHPELTRRCKRACDVARKLLEVEGLAP